MISRFPWLDSFICAPHARHTEDDTQCTDYFENVNNTIICANLSQILYGSVMQLNFSRIDFWHENILSMYCLSVVFLKSDIKIPILAFDPSVGQLLIVAASTM